MFRFLWGKITGADKKLTAPDQQASVGGRIGDYTVIYPYGTYCDLPDNTYLKEVGKGALISVTLDRPDDIETGEPTFFHPVTKTRIIFRNSGAIDIIGNGQDLNISDFNDVNVDLSGDMNINTPTGTLKHNGTNIGETHTHNGSPTAPDGPVSDTGQVV